MFFCFLACCFARYLKEKWGFTDDECVALFDDDNDIPMARECATGSRPLLRFMAAMLRFMAAMLAVMAAMLPLMAAMLWREQQGCPCNG